jgi:CRISPR-associated protein Cmr2
MNHRYIALSIDPVFGTIATARSTKALWTASYLFSWIMREILLQLRATAGVTVLNLPDNDIFFEGKPSGVGLFSDRCTARISPDTILKMPTIVQDIIKTLATEMCKDLNKERIQKYQNGKKQSPDPEYQVAEMYNFLRHYLTVHCIEFELDAADKNPIKTTDDLLNSLELQATIVPAQSRDGLSVFLEDLFFNFFIRKEFGADAGFPSTLEIATTSFARHNEKAYTAAVKTLRALDIDPDAPEAQKKQEVFIQAVREINKDRFKLCHKYIAIVCADGDNMGQLFKTLLEQDDTTLVQQLANGLADFSLEASKAIQSFGGTPVYAGGDDLLFFAPVSVEEFFIDTWKRRNIFHLLDTLDGLFETHVLKNIAKNDEIRTKIAAHLPSMSYGVSISHHKYPLAESLKNAQTLLYQQIKAHNNRNGIAWQITKHSGMGFGVVSKKNDSIHKIFRELLAVERKAEEQKDTFLASVMYKLDALEGLFNATKNAPRQHFEHIIFNNFNESVHRVNLEKDGKKQVELSPFLKKVTTLLIACVEDNTPQGKDKTPFNFNKKLDRAYAALRFVHFLETDDKA